MSSRGLREETTALGVPCVTLRENRDSERSSTKYGEGGKCIGFTALGWEGGGEDLGCGSFSEVGGLMPDDGRQKTEVGRRRAIE